MDSALERPALRGAMRQAARRLRRNLASEQSARELAATRAIFDQMDANDIVTWLAAQITVWFDDASKYDPWGPQISSHEWRACMDRLAALGLTHEDIIDDMASESVYEAEGNVVGGLVVYPGEGLCKPEATGAGA